MNGEESPLTKMIKQLSLQKESSQKPVHKFWNTQPVPQEDEIITENGPIEIKTIELVRQEPYNLPKDYEWFILDIDNKTDLDSVYDLLAKNYVEDDEALFRFDYSKEFLHWALKPPNWNREWHLGVRAKESKKLVGFISGVPADIQVYDSKMKLIEINFLCVHKKLRLKRLAPTLIKEVTRRINLMGIFQAVYTAGIYLPKPATTCRYYHRTLNPQKLVGIRFTAVPPDSTMAKMVQTYKIKAPYFDLVPMNSEDVGQVTTLLRNYHSTFDFTPCLSEEDVRHYLIPIENVIYSYVLKDENGRVTDFVSFYALNSSISGNPKYDYLKAAYLYYYVAKDHNNERAVKLVHDALFFAKQNEFDVFNCLDLAENVRFLDELKFGAGSGYLHYYLYNYKCKVLPQDRLALVML